MIWNLVSIAVILSFGGLDADGYVFNHVVNVQNVKLEDSYYNGVLNDISISFDVLGNFDIINQNLDTINPVGISSENGLDVSFRFDSAEGENEFVALRQDIETESKEEHWNSPYYSMLYINLITFELSIIEVSYSGIGLNCKYDLYLEIGTTNENFYYFTYEFDLLFQSSQYGVYLNQFANSWNNDDYYYGTIYSYTQFDFQSVNAINDLIELQNDFYEEQGRINGYEQGYQEGANSTPYGVLELITKPFVEMGKFLNIQIAPNLTLGMIIAIPIIVAIIGFLIKALIA